jgi:D-aminoacyl-tRNA deacylase
MKVVLQRVTSAYLSINEKLFACIKNGLLVLVGIEQFDEEVDAAWLAKKITQLRIFNDDHQIMNKNINEIEGQILVVSQFTLHAQTAKGNRPSYAKAAAPIKAKPLYNFFVNELQKNILTKVHTGVFGADMQINLTNDGPVTIILDTQNKQ